MPVLPLVPQREACILPPVRGPKYGDPTGIGNAILRVAEHAPDICICYLFGSSARGRLTPESDIDIAVASSRPLAEQRLYELQVDLEAALEAEVDLIDLQNVEGLILREILMKGTLVRAGDDEILAGLYKKMWFYEADMMPNYTMMLESRVRMFVDGGRGHPSQT